MRSRYSLLSAILLLPLVLPACVEAQGPSDSVRAAQEALQPTLPRELVSGIMLIESAADGTVLTLNLIPAADRPVAIDELAKAACSIETLRSLVAAGGTLRFSVRGREAGTVDTCPET